MQIFAEPPAWRTHWPRWPRMRLGVDIGDTAVRAVVLTRRKPAPVITRWACAELPEGAVRDGRILQPTVVARALRQCLGRGRWPKVVLALPGHQIGSAELAVPAGLTAQTGAGWVESEAKRLVRPMPGGAASSDALHYDAWPVSHAPGANPDAALPVPRACRVVAAPGCFVDDRLAVAEQAGLHTVAVDAEHYALQRAFVWGGAAPSRRVEGVSALAWLNGARLVLSLFDGAQCLGERTVAAPAMDGAAGWGMAVHSALAPWPARAPAMTMPPVSRVWLAGPQASHCPNMCDAVAAACSLPAALVDPFDGCAVSAEAIPLPPPAERPAYLLACGLAMHGEIA